MGAPGDVDFEEDAIADLGVGANLLGVRSNPGDGCPNETALPTAWTLSSRCPGAFAGIETSKNRSCSIIPVGCSPDNGSILAADGYTLVPAATIASTSCACSVAIFNRVIAVSLGVHPCRVEAATNDAKAASKATSQLTSLSALPSDKIGGSTIWDMHRKFLAHEWFQCCVGVSVVRRVGARPPLPQSA